MTEFYTNVFNTKAVTTITKDKITWYLAKDICDMIGYTNAAMAVSTHCEEEGTKKLYTLTSGGTQKMLFVDENNFWRLILFAKTETSKEIKEYLIKNNLTLDSHIRKK